MRERERETNNWDSAARQTTINDQKVQETHLKNRISDMETTRSVNKYCWSSPQKLTTCALIKTANNNGVEDRSRKCQVSMNNRLYERMDRISKKQVNIRETTQPHILRNTEEWINLRSSIRASYTTCRHMKNRRPVPRSTNKDNHIRYNHDEAHEMIQ